MKTINVRSQKQANTPFREKRFDFGNSLGILATIMQAVSVKNTKQELLDAYEALVREAKEKDVTSPKLPTATIKTSTGNFQKAVETLIIIKSAIDNAVSSLEKQKLAQIDDEEQARLELSRFHEDMKRTRAELDYELKRRRQEKTDELETELAAHQRQHETRLTEENEAIRRRQEMLKVQEDELEQLRKKTALFPKELEKTVQDAIDATRVEEQNKAKVARDLIEKQVEGERALAKLRIENLEKTAKEQAEEIRQLKTQLERATSQVKDIAVSVIDSNRPTSPVAARE